MSSHGEESAYARAGVDYGALDAGKRDALTEALATSALLELRGGRALDASRGEPAFVFELGDRTLAFVLEGLGTKSLIARAVLETTGSNRFADIGRDTVAAIVNDLCCVGALPLVVNAYFATGTGSWYDDHARSGELIAGWRAACEEAGAVWGGGESPSLPGLVAEADIELAGSAVGAVPAGQRAILGQDLGAGDEIVFVAATGMHANGSSLARMIAGELPGGYATELPSGRAFGEALLDPAPVYAPLIADLLAARTPVHYLSHITGHGLLKLMRPARELTYRIERLGEVPEVLTFMARHAGMAPAEAYSTLNMGWGYAVYCAEGAGRGVVELARRHGLAAHIAGRVEEGPRQVILEPVGVVFGDEAMDLTPRGRGDQPQA